MARDNRPVPEDTPRPVVPDVLLLNPLKPSGNYINHRLLHSVTLHFVFMDLVRFLV